MTRINIDINDRFLDAFNVFKVKNKDKIEEIFGKADQATTFQYILLNYFRCEELGEFSDMIGDKQKLEI